MQMTGWIIQSSLLVLSGLKKSFTLDVITRRAVNNHFPLYWAIFGMVTNKRQPGGPRASLLLTSVRRQSFAIEIQIETKLKCILGFEQDHLR